ncbi:MAG: magnesium transporter CorA family protein [Candidatus Eremiobacteraeota bacterium]|nr:magnesium transporter CorA family protein [Candidatus Eremiobacteraeota bacterium]
MWITHVDGGLGLSSTTCSIYRNGDAPRPLADLTNVSEVLKEDGAFVWFDAVDPTTEDLALIRDEFALHPLAVEDAVAGHQRTKIDRYGDSWFIAARAVSEAGQSMTLHELAIFAGPKFVVTVRREPAYPLDEVIRRWEHDDRTLPRTAGALLYELLDTVVDGYSVVGESLEDRTGALEDALLDRRDHNDTTLLDIFAIGRSIQRFRRAIGPMRDVLVPLIRGDAEFIEAMERPYYHDVNDHVERVLDQMDSAKELVTKTLEVHLGLATQRQGEVTRQLTIIATVFLPLSFITGFFGQNFAFLVNGIASPWLFIVLGIGSQLLTLTWLFLYFKRKRWL